jgi:glycosyltransferase involved in cell wall biosynthesis
MIWGVICSPADVYHLGKPQPVNGLAALIAIWLLRRKRFYVDCDDDEVTSNRLTAGWQRAVFGFWQWLLPRLAAGVTVNTRFLERQVRAAGQRHVVYVPNGVSETWFTRPSERSLAGLRAGLGLSGKQVIAYVGTLSLQNHPVDLLLEAFALLSVQHPQLALLIVGGGEDLELLREQARTQKLQDRVYFTGHVAYSAVPTFLALAAVSVDPVHDDVTARARSPLKIVESLALGVPVVTGDVGDRREMVGTGGSVVQPGDAAALAGGVAVVLMTPQQPSSRSIEQFRWAALAKSWAVVYCVPAP